jgi:hypothetical protein
VLAALPQVITPHLAALGLAGVSYPALPTVPRSPWLMVRQSLYAPTRVVKARAGLQVVRAGIDLVVLVTDHGDPGDAARVDGIPERLLDLFDANAYGGNVNAAFAGTDLPDSLSHVWTEALVRRMALSWFEAGACHAAIVTLDTEFQRRAELP